MTSNQIAYTKAKEDKRHNLATEYVSYMALSETMRSNRANEEIKWAQVNESIRHNTVDETETHRANVFRETETNRHNVEDEALKRAQLAESNRHNVEDEAIKAAQLAEQKRANSVNEFIKLTEIEPTIAGSVAAGVYLANNKEQLQNLLPDAEDNVKNTAAAVDEWWHVKVVQDMKPSDVDVGGKQKIELTPYEKGENAGSYVTKGLEKLIGGINSFNQFGAGLIAKGIDWLAGGTPSVSSGAPFVTGG